MKRHTSRPPRDPYQPFRDPIFAPHLWRRDLVTAFKWVRTFIYSATLATAATIVLVAFLSMYVAFVLSLLFTPQP